MKLWINYLTGDFNWLIFFLYIYKMYLIPAEGYTNAWVHILSIKKTGDICASMKNVHYGLGVKTCWFSFKRNTWQIWNKKPYK